MLNKPPVSATVQEMAVFCRFIETGSISMASDILGFSISTSRRAIHSLEKKVGKTLFSKSGKSTSQAIKLYVPTRDLLYQYRNIFQSGVNYKDPSETIVLYFPSIASAIAAEHILPVIKQKCPNTCIELITFTPAFIKTLAKIFDYMFDYMFDYKDFIIIESHLSYIIPKRSWAVVRDWSGFGNRLYAGKKYIEKYSEPKVLEDLKQHRCLSRDGLDAETWVFEHDGSSCTVEIDPYMSIDNEKHMVAAVDNNIGIARLGNRAVAALASDNVVEILSDYHMPEYSIVLLNNDKTKSKKQYGEVQKIIENVMTEMFSTLFA